VSHSEARPGFDRLIQIARDPLIASFNTAIATDGFFSAFLSQERSLAWKLHLSRASKAGGQAFASFSHHHLAYLILEPSNVRRIPLSIIQPNFDAVHRPDRKSVHRWK
jgi:hypothetical protein